MGCSHAAPCSGAAFHLASSLGFSGRIGWLHHPTDRTRSESLIPLCGYGTSAGQELSEEGNRNAWKHRAMPRQGVLCPDRRISSLARHKTSCRNLFLKGAGGAEGPSSFSKGLRSCWGPPGSALGDGDKPPPDLPLVVYPTPSTRCQ